MLPSAHKKICCNDQTCPKRNPKKEDAVPAASATEDMLECVGSDKATCPKRNQKEEDAVPAASFTEDMPECLGSDETTFPKRNLKEEVVVVAASKTEEMPQCVVSDKAPPVSLVKTSPSVQTLIPTKTTEKSTEAYFDRNHENISSYLKKFCSSNSFKTSPTESQISANILNFYPSTTTREKFQTWHMPQPLTRGLHKCTCKKLNVTPSSSCSSFSSEYWPKVQLSSQHNQTQERAQCLQRTPVKRVNISHDELSRTDAAPAETPKSFPINQPQLVCKEPLQGFEKLSTTYDQQLKPDYLSQCEEHFYSCSSEDSEDDEKSENFFGSQYRCHNETNKNDAILQLLNEVENLINKGNPKQKKAENDVKPSSPAGRLSKETIQESQIQLRVNEKVSKSTSTTQLDSMLWLPQSWLCNCCAHMLPHNFSYFPPYNLANPAFDCTQIPPPCVCEENNSFKSAGNGSRSLLTADQLADNLSCACFAAPDPLEYNIKSPCSSLSAVNNHQMDVSVQTNESLCFKGCDTLNNQIFCEDNGSFKDCSSGKNSVLTADHWLATHTTCKYVCKQICLEYKDEMLTLSCLPIAGSKSNELACTCPKNNSFESQVNKKFNPNPLEAEVYVDKTFTDSLSNHDGDEPALDNYSNDFDFVRIEELLPSEMHHPCSDCLMEYDDEEPNFKQSFETVEKVNKESELVDLAKTSKQNIEPFETAELEMFPAPMEFAAELVDLAKTSEQKIEPFQTTDLEMYPAPMEFAVELESEKDIDSTQYRAIQELVHTKENEEIEKLNESNELIEVEDEKVSQNIANDELDILSYNKDDELNEAEKQVDNVEESDASSPTTGQNILNFLPEIDEPRDSKQLISYDYNSEEEQELAKEKFTEDHKREKLDDNERIPDNEMGLAPLKQEEAKDCSAEMKFFIDSLILDLEAMDYARRKSQFEKNICSKSEKLAHCMRDSFPVTITEVTDLGANSLYVKWKIHDCLGVGGYEIYTDGYLTNRFYNSRHNAAVITQVDITLPHKIALVAQPEATDNSLDFICNASRKKDRRLKSLVWSKADESQRGALWTPSIFLYDPFSARSILTPAFSRNDI